MRKMGFGEGPRMSRLTMWEAIRQGKFIEWMFGIGDKKAKVKEKTLMNLSLNDIVTYEEIEYVVKDKYIYNDGGFIWNEYTLDDNGKVMFLSVEDDDELEIGIFHKISLEVEEPVASKIKYDGVKYKLDEHSYAKVDTFGLRGNKQGVKVEYWDFECDDDAVEYDLLSIEKWGGTSYEVCRGKSCKEYEFKLLPGGGIEEDE